MTLAFDLWPWPLNSSKALASYILTPNFVSVRQKVQPWEGDWHTQTPTDGTDSITSTADVGGQNTLNL